MLCRADQAHGPGQAGDGGQSGGGCSLQEAPIKEAALAVLEADTAGLLDGIDDAFRSAMWLFRSGVNKRAPLGGGGGGGGAPGAKERLLEPLWAVAAGPVDAWSQTFIRKRFY